RRNRKPVVTEAGWIEAHEGHQPAAAASIGSRIGQRLVRREHWLGAAEPGACFGREGLRPSSDRRRGADCDCRPPGFRPTKKSPLRILLSARDEILRAAATRGTDGKKLGSEIRIQTESVARAYSIEESHNARHTLIESQGAEWGAIDHWHAPGSRRQLH